MDYKPLDFTDLIQRLFYVIGIGKSDIETLTYSELRSYAFAKAEVNGFSRMSLLDDVAIAYSSCKSKEGGKIRRSHFRELLSSFKEHDKSNNAGKKKIKDKEKAKANKIFFQNAKLNVPQ